MGEPRPLSRVHFASDLLRIGSFAVAPADPRFRAAGQITGHEFVFPRSSVWIHPAGEPAFLADPTVVTYYNPNEPYTRSRASAEGDRCDWFTIERSALLELMQGS